jgi:hypothetical protein
MTSDPEAAFAKLLDDIARGTSAGAAAKLEQLLGSPGRATAFVEEVVSELTSLPEGQS